MNLNVAKVQEYVEQMTNWQRHQWARAKRPNDVASLEKFATMKRPEKLVVVKPELLPFDFSQVIKAFPPKAVKAEKSDAPKPPAKK